VRKKFRVGDSAVESCDRLPIGDQRVDDSWSKKIRSPEDENFFRCASKYV